MSYYPTPAEARLHRFIDAVVRSRPDVVADPQRPRLAEATERRLLGELEGWRARADAARAAYVEAHGPADSVTHAVEAVPMSPREAEAMAGLYAGVVALLAQRCHEVWLMSPSDGREGLVDVLPQTYEMAVRSAVTFDPEQARWFAWCRINTSWMIHKACRREDAHDLYEETRAHDLTERQPFDDGAYEPADHHVGFDDQSFLDGLAREIAEEHADCPAVAEVYARLFRS